MDKQSFCGTQRKKSPSAKQAQKCMQTTVKFTVLKERRRKRPELLLANSSDETTWTSDYISVVWHVVDFIVLMNIFGRCGGGGLAIWTLMASFIASFASCALIQEKEEQNSAADITDQTITSAAC